MCVEQSSGCKINLILNILGKRPDGFHELETILLPVPVWDRLEFSRAASGVELSCSDPRLPVDGTNLVIRAAHLFLERAGIKEGIRIRLEKHIPVAAGLGGGSSNAAHTLSGLNELFDQCLTDAELIQLAVQLGSDVPFFLQSRPALGTGRGERITALGTLSALRGCSLVLLYPGFGIPTAWAYRSLAQFPEAVQGRPGRALELVRLLEGNDPRLAAAHFLNSLEAPALRKYPILRLYQEFMLEQGALAARMSGSGSTTFALVDGPEKADTLAEECRREFGRSIWISSVPAAAQISLSSPVQSR